MASLIYNAFKHRQLGDTGITPVNLKTDTIKVALVTSTYTPSADNHDFFNDITNEVSATGYTAGGVTLTVTTSQDNTDDEGVFDASDASWASSSITARGAVIYKDTGTPSTSPIIAYIDFGTDKTSDGGTFQITWASEGIINLN
jgi:hypothetical protein